MIGIWYEYQSEAKASLTAWEELLLTESGEQKWASHIMWLYSYYGQDEPLTGCTPKLQTANNNYLSMHSLKLKPCLRLPCSLLCLVPLCSLSIG